MNQPEQAEAEFKRVLELQPKQARAWNALGRLYVRQNRWPDAAQAFTKATDLAPTDASSWYDLGLTLQRLNRPDQAIPALKRAAQLRPVAPDYWFTLGLTAMSSRNYDEAISAFQQAAKLVPNEPEPALWLANAYAAKGMQGRIRSRVRTSAAIGPSQSRATEATALRTIAIAQAHPAQQAQSSPQLVPANVGPGTRYKKLHRTINSHAKIAVRFVVMKQSWHLTKSRTLASAYFLLLVFFISSSNLAAQNGSSSFDEIAAEATAARDAEDTPRAIELYTQALQLNPNWEDGWWSLGLAAIRIRHVCICN